MESFDPEPLPGSGTIKSRVSDHNLHKQRSSGSKAAWTDADLDSGGEKL